MQRTPAFSKQTEVWSGAQVRAARVLAGLSQAALARDAGIDVLTVRRMEAAQDGPIPCRRYSIEAVQRALAGTGPHCDLITTFIITPDDSDEP